jgi:transposase-like protein
MTSQSEFIPIEREVEVSAKAERRRFTAEYKRKILKEADGCSRPGELGALLRREGLYSSHLAAWRRAREAGGLAGLTPKKRGPRAPVVDPRDQRIVELEREVRRLTARLERTEALIEVQKKVSLLLGSDSTSNNEER